MPFIPPELQRTGPSKTVKQGDDFTEEVKTTMADLLRSLVDDPDDGNRHSDVRPSTNAALLSEHDNTTFFHELEPQDFAEFRVVADRFIESGIGSKDILARFEGTIGGETATDDQEAQRLAEPGVIAGSISKVLNNNRFNPTSTYGEQFSDDGVIAVMPTDLGEFNPAGAEARLDNLKKIGCSLMLRATGEFIQGDPLSPGVSLASLLPGQAQLGIQIDARNMHAENVFGAPGVDPGVGPIRARLRDILKGESIRSFGQLNSFNEPFNGFLPLGMTGLAIILVIALRLVTTAFVRILGFIMGKPFGPGGGKLSTDPRRFGQFGRQTTSSRLMPITLSDIGIIELDRDFVATVDEGLKTFFDFDPITGGFERSIGQIARSPGFYANMVRVIIQSGQRIIQDAIDAFQTIAGGNVVAGVQAVFGIIDVLKTSKVIAFLNIMSILGDRSFAEQDIGADKAPRRSVIDALPDNAASRIMKSRVRLRDGRTTLAWRNSSPVSALVLPNVIKAAARTLGTSMVSYEAGLKTLEQDAVDNDVETRDINRFTFQQVEEIEKRLDAEYVPFYFHDLRTNEIVSFHAFINAVNETFTPTYGETTPYGRIDPVMTYGSTRREFSLTFHVVATSPDDFDLMYVKLNKLTTLLYPQWTRGRSVVDADGRQFTQPFSQLPAASPLCRIRLGNLMRTNFSNIALGRLFGLGSQDFLNREETQTADTALFDAVLDSRLAQIDSVGFAPGQTATLLPVGFKDINDRSSILPPALQGLENEEVRRKFNRVSERPMEVKIKQPVISLTEYEGEEVPQYDVEIQEPGLEGIELTVPASALTPSIKDIEDRIALVLPSPPFPPPAEDERASFLDASQNAVVRSFRNVQGKGLAGFITSLNIDWNEADGSWDVERFSARAPQLLRIDLTFAVIHDIPPGIDADGFNRAPIWPVGDIMHESFGDAYDVLDGAKARFKEQFGRIKGKVK